MKTWSMKCVAPTVAAVLGLDAPTFIIAQFGNVDSTFHAIGPSNPGVVPMLEELDRTLRKLVARLLSEGVSVVVLADHGQHDNPDQAAAKRGAHGDDCPEDRLVPCTWVRA